MTNQTSSIFLDSDANNYPLDKFSVTFTVRGFFNTSTATTSSSAKQPLPINVNIFGTPLGWSLQYTATALVDNTAALLTIYGARNPTTITFALLILGLMWTMSILAVFLAYATWFKESKKLELPYLLITIALLFAIPTIRNAMPSVPAVGVLADQMVTGWALLLLSGSVVSHFVNLLWSLWKEGSDAKKKLLEELGVSGLEESKNEKGFDALLVVKNVNESVNQTSKRI
ncbi:UNVERIFIED_CONTAM: hypothetical protein HDU68_003464, partial [Siphonaria sp. JEL0065]